jgi:hypothetical protein
MITHPSHDFSEGYCINCTAYIRSTQAAKRCRPSIDDYVVFERPPVVDWSKTASTETVEF